MKGGTKTTRRAFTLVELLVASAITALLSALLLALAVNVLQSWSRSGGALAASAQARLALEQIARDLQGAIFRDDGRNVWLIATVTADRDPGRGWQDAAVQKPAQLDLTAPDLSSCRFGRAGAWFDFFTTKPTTGSTGSLPVAVGYQLLRRGLTGNSAASPHYVLLRSEVRPVASGGRPGVLETGYDLDPAEGGAYFADSSPVYQGDASSLTHPVVSGAVLGSMLADNVVDFGVRLYAREESGALRLVFPADATGNPATPAGPFLARGVFPVVAEVMLRVLTDEGVRRIAALESGRATGDWWQIALAHSQVFIRRVVIQTRPLG